MEAEAETDGGLLADIEEGRMRWREARKERRPRRKGRHIRASMPVSPVKSLWHRRSNARLHPAVACHHGILSGGFPRDEKLVR